MLWNYVSFIGHGHMVKDEYGWRHDTGSSWMEGEVLSIISLSYLRAARGRVSTHLGEPRGWRRSSSRH
ncbi:hypothetical protein Hanom_Chr14g01283971 [Helianthus anomalus]